MGQTSLNYDESFKELPIVLGTQHAISLGYSVRLCCRSKHVMKEFRASQRAVAAFRDVGTKGLHAVWNQNREVILFIEHEHEGREIALSRILEVIVHECSHAIDAFFERAGVRDVDTEIRAYYMDWLVGRCFWLFSFVRSRSSGEKNAKSN